MITELRCGSKKFGEILDDEIIEIKCSSTFCGAAPGRVVLHRFNLEGKLLETLRFRDPGGRK